MEEEINIIDWARLIIRKKKTIFVCILLTISFALLTIFDVLSENKEEIVLEVGGFYDRQADIRKPIAAFPEIVLGINNGLYGSYRNVKVFYSDDSFFLTIKISDKKSVEELKKPLQAIGDKIIQKHNELIEVKRKNIEERIEKMEQIIKDRNIQDRDSAIFQLEVLNLKEYKDNFSPTKIASGPIIEEKNYNFIFFYLLTAIISGLILGIFVVFFLEWWNKNNGKILNQ